MREITYEYQLYESQIVHGGGVERVWFIDVYKRDQTPRGVESPLSFLFRKRRDERMSLEDDLEVTFEEAAKYGLIEKSEIPKKCKEISQASKSRQSVESI